MGMQIKMRRFHSFTLCRKFEVTERKKERKSKRTRERTIDKGKKRINRRERERKFNILWWR